MRLTFQFDQPTRGSCANASKQRFTLLIYQGSVECNTGARGCVGLKYSQQISETRQKPIIAFAIEHVIEFEAQHVSRVGTSVQNDRLFGIDMQKGDVGLDQVGVLKTNVIAIGKRSNWYISRWYQVQRFGARIEHLVPTTSARVLLSSFLHSI
jgi:hypothetical protein